MMALSEHERRSPTLVGMMAEPVQRGGCRRATLAVCVAALAFWFGCSDADAQSPGATAPQPIETSAPECAPNEQNEVSDAWHGLSQCLRRLRNIWRNQGPLAQLAPNSREAVAVSTLVRLLVADELARPRTAVASQEHSGYAPYRESPNTLKETGSRLALLNDLKQPYNAMGQTGLAYVLYTIVTLTKSRDYPGASEDGELYSAVANAAVRTVVTPVERGGLASRSPCARAEAQCAWYHSVTDRGRETRRGATLNQHLHAVRDLILIGAIAHETGDLADVNFEAAASEGLNQLFLAAGHDAAGQPPNLQDFVVESRHGDGQIAYYGFDPSAAPPKGGYFLRSERKNCDYQRHSLDLLASILKDAKSERIQSASYEAASACTSPIRSLHETTEAASEKLASQFVDEARAALSECSSPERYKRARGTGVYFESLFSACLTPPASGR